MKLFKLGDKAWFHYANGDTIKDLKITCIDYSKETYTAKLGNGGEIIAPFEAFTREGEKPSVYDMLDRLTRRVDALERIVAKDDEQ